MHDLATIGGDICLMIEQDDSLLRTDCHQLFGLARATGQRDTLQYEHQRASTEPLLALPDIVAWCWVRSGDWRRRAAPIITTVRDL